MRVLHICSYYLGSKLYENLFLNLENLIKNYVYVPVNQNEKKEVLNRNVLISKVFTTLDRFFFFRKNKKILLDIEDKIRINEFDLLHAHTLFTNGYVAYKIKKKYNKKYIVAVRNTDINIFFRYFFFLRKLGIKILENSSKNRARIIFCLSVLNDLYYFVLDDSDKFSKDEYWSEFRKVKKLLYPYSDKFYDGLLEKNVGNCC